MKFRLRQIEKGIKDVIESLASIIPDAHSTELLLHALVKSMESNLVVADDRKEWLPDRYVISIPANQPKEKVDIEKLFPVMKTALEQLALENGQEFQNAPQFEIQETDALHNKKISVRSFFSNSPTPTTAASHPSSHPVNPVSKAAGMLLRNGCEPFLLNSTVTNIGRREDNHLVIRDPAVSRLHAQIRNSSRGIIIFDLNSSEGTFVNGKRIARQKLNSGDVISLAGVKLLFVTEKSGSDQLSEWEQTKPMTQVPVEKRDK